MWNVLSLAWDTQVYYYLDIQARDLTVSHSPIALLGRIASCGIIMLFLIFVGFVAQSPTLLVALISLLRLLR